MDAAAREALRARIHEAIRRVTTGTAPMRIPAERTDPDRVLSECLDLLATLDALAAERDAVVALLRSAVGIASSYRDDDQVGCLCIETCYCKSGRLDKIEVEMSALAPPPPAGDGEKAQ